MATDQTAESQFKQHPTLPDDKLRNLIDYDVIPELEQHLHKMVKRIHQSMDKLPDEEEDPGIYNAEEADELLQNGTNLDII